MRYPYSFIINHPMSLVVKVNSNPYKSLVELNVMLRPMRAGGCTAICVFYCTLQFYS